MITDRTMPIITGLDITKEVPGLKPGMPIVMCTGFTDILNREAAAKIGIKAYLMKPLGYNELATSVRNLLGENKQDNK